MTAVSAWAVADAVRAAVADWAAPDGGVSVDAHEREEFVADVAAVVTTKIREQ